MKLKTAITSLSLLAISGCAYTEINDVDMKLVSSEEISETKLMNEDLNKSNFYHAMIGSLMEFNGQNNNAINHYEAILSNGYERLTVDKLLALYQSKNDYVGISNILLKIPENDIINNHHNYLFSYYITHGKYLNAKKIFIKDLNNIENEPYHIYIDKRLKKYELIIKKLNSLDVVYIGAYKEFLNNLKVTNYSEYYTIKKIEKILKDEKDLDINYTNLNKDDKSFFVLYNYYYNPTVSLMYQVESSGYDFFFLSPYINNHFKSAIEINDYQQVKFIANHLSKNINKDEVNLDYLEFSAYLFLFENENALYKLEYLKNSISDDLYFYFKGLINYRLGFKSASKKYFSEIKDLITYKDFIDFNVYIDVIGENELLINSMTSIEVLNYKLEYSLIKRDFKKANFVKSEILKNKNYIKGKNELVYSNLLYLDFFNNEDNAIKTAKINYENKSSGINANSYAYFLALANKDIKNGISIIEPFLNIDEVNPSFLDTYAWLLYKDGRYQDALDVYINNNMLMITNFTVQEHIYKAYYKIGDMVKYDYHKDISKQIFN